MVANSAASRLDLVTLLPAVFILKNELGIFEPGMIILLKLLPVRNVAVLWIAFRGIPGGVRTRFSFATSSGLSTSLFKYS